MSMLSRWLLISSPFILGCLSGCGVTSINGLQGEISMIGEGGTTISQEGTSTIKVKSEAPDSTEPSTHTLVIHSLSFSPDRPDSKWGREHWKNKPLALFRESSGGYIPFLYAQLPPGSIPNMAKITQFSCLLADADNTKRIVIELYRFPVGTQLNYQSLATLSTTVAEASGEWQIVNSGNLNITYHEDSSYLLSFGLNYPDTYGCRRCYLRSCSVNYQPAQSTQ